MYEIDNWTYCIAQGTLNALWWPQWEEYPKKRGYVYTCSWFTLLCVSAQPSPTLCDRMDCSPPGSSVHGILQARILEWVDMPSNPGMEPVSSALQADFLPLCHLRSPSLCYTVETNTILKSNDECALSHFSQSSCLQSYGQYSLPGSSVPGILQARKLEWVVKPSSRGSSGPRDQTHISLHLLNWQVGFFKPLTSHRKPPKETILQ